MTAQWRHVGEHLARGLDAGDVGRVVQGCQVGQLTEGRQRVLVNDHRLGELVSPVHHAVAHRLDVGEARDGPHVGVQQRLHDQLDCLLVVGAVVLPLDLLSDPPCVVADERPADGNAFDDTLRKDVALFPAIELILERRAAAVEGQNVHWMFPFIRGKPPAGPGRALSILSDIRNAFSGQADGQTKQTTDLRNAFEAQARASVGSASCIPIDARSPRVRCPLAVLLRRRVAAFCRRLLRVQRRRGFDSAL